MRLLGVLSAATFTLVAACGGGGGGDDSGGPGPTPQQTLDRIQPSVTTLNLTAGRSATIQMTAFDTQGGTISNPGAYTFTSAAPNIAEVNQQGAVVAVAAGNTTITISLTRSGVTKQATVQVAVTGTLGTSATVAAGSANTFDPQTVAIAIGGEVTWSFGPVIHNVTFSTGGAPSNVPNSSNTTAQRTFNAAGNFPYDCTIHAGMNGTVIVR